jgi:serine/threonine protein phosphatase 1
VRSTVWPHEKFLVRGRRPSLAARLRVYAIGDIHGRLDLLNQLLSLIDADIAQFPAIRPVYVFPCDYIDRGHWSRETIEPLIEHDAEQKLYS